MFRLRHLPAVLLLGLLAACDQAAPPTPTPTVATPIAQSQARPTDTARPAPATPAASQPTSTTRAPVSAATTPTRAPISAAKTPTTPPTAAVSKEIVAELDTYFEIFYNARSAENGAVLILDTNRNLTDEYYRDYTMPLLRKTMDDLVEGRLREVTYSGISVQVDDWRPEADGKGVAEVRVTRTKHEERVDSAPTDETATLRFLVKRRGDLDWAVVDFLNPATNKWISESVPPVPQEVKTGAADYFREFYEARTLTAGGKLNISRTEDLTAFAYEEYTIPLLRRQQADADAGKLDRVFYTDIKTEVLRWHPEATSHGGIAVVKVTRTANVVRPGGAEPPRTETFEFRVHQHHDEPGEPPWVAVDFLNPSSGVWVSESAGMTAPIPQDAAT